MFKTFISDHSIADTWTSCGTASSTWQVWVLLKAEYRFSTSWSLRTNTDSPDVTSERSFSLWSASSVKRMEFTITPDARTSALTSSIRGSLFSPPSVITVSMAPLVRLSKLPCRYDKRNLYSG